MPGSVANASPFTVLPLSLCRAFSHAREYAVIDNEYKNGESQRSKQVATSRKSWKTTRRLTPALLASFRSFYENRRGPLEPFYFYDPWDSGFTYDASGTQALGRYTVRFAGNWEQMVGIGRAEVDIALVELA
jgi:hypothetical protein